MTGGRARPRVVVLDDYESGLASSSALQALGDRVELVAFDRPLDPSELAAAVEGAPIVIAVRERTTLSAQNLRHLGRGGPGPAGVELLLQTGGHAYHVDIEAATREGILVALGRGSKKPTPVVAELVMGYLLAWYRHLVPSVRGMREGGWPSSLGRTLHGRTLGILGLGRHGVTVARRARAFGMDVIAWGPSLTAERAAAEEAECLPLDEVLQRADAVTVHLRLSPTSTGLIGARELDLMGPGTLLINTSRGPIVDEDALVAALRDQRIEGAALDVFDAEPLPGDHPLRTLDNVLCTPHIGYTVDAAFRDFAETSAAQLEAYLDGRLDPELVLNPEVAEQRSLRWGGLAASGIGDGGVGDGGVGDGGR